MATATTDTPNCECCNNPWARATGDFFAKLCMDCDDDKTKTSAAAPVEFGLSRDNMDLSVKPSDNFFEYANGNWMKKNPIPAGYPSWNTFLALHVQSQERCKVLLEELAANPSSSAEEAKVAAFYVAAMDEDAIEQAGIKPMKPLLDAIDKIVTTYQKKDMTEYATLIGKLASTYGTFWFVLLFVSFRFFVGAASLLIYFLSSF
jgi:predicted metalloendopeptidase